MYTFLYNYNFIPIAFMDEGMFLTFSIYTSLLYNCNSENLLDFFGLKCPYNWLTNKNYSYLQRRRLIEILE